MYQSVDSLHRKTTENHITLGKPIKIYYGLRFPRPEPFSSNTLCLSETLKHALTDFMVLPQC